MKSLPEVTVLDETVGGEATYSASPSVGLLYTHLLFDKVNNYRAEGYGISLGVSAAYLFSSSEFSEGFQPLPTIGMECPTYDFRSRSYSSWFITALAGAFLPSDPTYIYFTLGLSR